MNTSALVFLLAASLNAEATQNDERSTQADLRVQIPSGLDDLSLSNEPGWWMAPLETVGFLVGLSATDRVLNADPTYRGDLGVIVDHLKGPWEYDGDGFMTNQLGHPYQGSIYFASARSLGKGFWESSLYTAMGSLMWELGGEIQAPAINDQITTTISGSFVGEVLYRLANRVLDYGARSDSALAPYAAAALAPYNALNRYFYPDADRDWARARQPILGELRLSCASLDGPATGEAAVRGHYTLSLSAHLLNGAPGSGLRVRAPFDYYDASATIGTSGDSLRRDVFASVSIHGLLAGMSFGEDDDATGHWGLFGTYEYLTPSPFRVSTSALGLGSVAQLRVTDDVVLLGKGIVSLGFGAAGALGHVVEQRDYQYGLQAVAELETGLVIGKRVRLDLGLRHYRTTGDLSPEPDGLEQLTLASAAVSWRVAANHVIRVDGRGSLRNADHLGSPHVEQRVVALMVSYAIQLDTSLGVAGRPEREL